MRISSGRDETEETSPRVAREYYLQVSAHEWKVRREDTATVHSQRGYGEVILVILGIGAEVAGLRVHHRNIRYRQKSILAFKQDEIALALMQVIRSGALDEESEANSTRTISLDSSTTVDEISKINFLHNSKFLNPESQREV